MWLINGDSYGKIKRWRSKGMQKKNLSWLLGADRKICSSGSLFGITRQSPVMPNSDLGQIFLSAPYTHERVFIIMCDFLASKGSITQLINLHCYWCSVPYGSPRNLLILHPSPVYIFLSFGINDLILGYLGYTVLLNPHLPSGLFQPYQMDGSISSLRGVWCTISF